MPTSFRTRLRERLRSVSIVGLFIELAVVFIGVYLAFLLSNYQAEREMANESERVTELLKVGINRYEQSFGSFARYHADYNARFRAALEQGEIPDFSDAIYPAPQYPIDAINYILTSESYNVFSLEVYVPLVGFVNAVQRMMYTEEKLVGLAEQFRPLPPPDAPDYARARTQQWHLAQRYYRYLEVRKNVAEELERRANELDAQLAELTS